MIQISYYKRINNLKQKTTSSVEISEEVLHLR